MINYLINAFLYLYFPFTLLAMIYYIIVYESKQLTLLKMIVSELPVAQLSNDSNFHEYIGNSELRYSLFYLPIGIYKIYFLTWTRDRKFHFLKILSLKELCDTKIEEKENKLQSISGNSYEKYTISNETEKQQHILLLQDLSKQMQEREKTVQFKAMFYITALAAILSVLVSKFDKITNILSLTTTEQVVIALILLYILNALFLLLSFLSVGSYKSETYSHFRDSIDKDKLYYMYWYKQYQRLQKYTDRDVSYISNIEKYLKIITAWTIALALIILIKELMK